MPAKPKKKKRPSPRELANPNRMPKQARVELAVDLIRLGYCPSDVVKRVQTQGKVSRAQARQDCDAAYAHFESDEKVNLSRPRRRSAMRASLQLVFRRALAANKYTPAIRALENLCKLDGLYQDVTEVTGKIEHHVIETMTSTEQAKRLDELVAQYNELQPN